MGSSCVREGSYWLLVKISLLSGQALAQAVQGSGGVPIAGGVQKPYRCIRDYVSGSVSVSQRQEKWWWFTGNCKIWA